MYLFLYLGSVDHYTFKELTLQPKRRPSQYRQLANIAKSQTEPISSTRQYRQLADRANIVN